MMCVNRNQPWLFEILPWVDVGVFPEENVHWVMLSYGVQTQLKFEHLIQALSEDNILFIKWIDHSVDYLM